jgi:predicted PurR-regulated permease PerM
MTAQQQLRYWLIGLLIGCVLIYLLREVLAPFVAGIGVAYLLDPLADRLERWKFPRWLAALVVLTLFFVAFVLLVLLVVPLLNSQVIGLVQAITGYLAESREAITQYAMALVERFDLQGGEQIKEALGGFAKDAVNIVGKLLAEVWQGGLALVSLLSLLVITPVVAFYLLRDFDRIVETVDGWLPRQHAPTIRRLVGEIDQRLAGFVRGQGSVCLVLGAFYAIGLSLAGLDFGLVIGLISGVLSFIPFVGSAIGLLLSMITAVTQFWPDLLRIAVVLGVFVVGQFLEGNVLTPRLVGDRVGLHPVWVMFALLAGGALAGFVGVLLAVPIAAAAGVLIRFFMSQYLGSRLYDHGPKTPPDSP